MLAQEGLESIGQKLYNTINELIGKPQSARRWIWELLQNAKDVIDENGKIEIELTDDYVSFAHNGKPFSHDNLLAILSQRSTKPPVYTDETKRQFFDRLFSGQDVEEEEAKTFLNTTGRFGTGFMTTYLLSKTVFLEGIYQNGGILKKFRLSLDRQAASPEEMKYKVKLSFSEFTTLEKEETSPVPPSGYRPGQDCNTKFIYQLDSSRNPVAATGIKDLHHSIALVFSFVPALKSVTVNEHGQQTTYTRLPPKSQGAVTIEQVEKRQGTQDSKFQIARVASRFDALVVAVPVRENEDGRYEILCRDIESPGLFISFPLIGSESFPFPATVHSPLFNPDDTRSHLFLNLTNEPLFNTKVELNRELLRQAVSLYSQLLETATEYKWNNLYYLAASGLPGNSVDDWYKLNIQKELRRKILHHEMVITEDGENGTRAKPIDMKFPVHREETFREFWNLCEPLYGKSIPRKQDAEAWKKIIEVNIEDWEGADFGVTLEKLLLLVQSTSRFSDFNECYFRNESAAFESLNKIIRFTENEDKELLNRKENPMKVFPTQAPGSPFSEKQKLSRDAGVPHPFKDILTITGDDWYEKLVRDEITVFERESRLTVKDVSEKIRDRTDKYIHDKLSPEDRQLWKQGMFHLAGYTPPALTGWMEALHGFLRQLFEGISTGVEEIYGADDFDWRPFKQWAVGTILKRVSTFGNLDRLSLHLTGKHYPTAGVQPGSEEEDSKYRVDTFLNEVINFATTFDKNLLSDFLVIPNQLNILCRYGANLYNDQEVPDELKAIMSAFNKDCRDSLLHQQITITLPSQPRDLKWICSQLDDIAIKEQDNPDMKQPLRELDKWISRTRIKGTVTGMDDLFKSFYRKRSGIVLNTYSLEERNQFDEIQQSGLGSDLAAMVKSGANAETLKEVTRIVQSNPGVNPQQLSSIANLLKDHPDLTPEKIGQLLETSKGWNPEMTYTPDVYQERRNFENGWKGEAFVYTELSRRGFSAEWRNLSAEENGNAIIDFEEKKWFVKERYDKYDIVAKSQGGKTFYIQVKSTTTGIADADQIALPISTNEWNFVFETKENEAYYLARVFNVTNAPVAYFMRLERADEL